MVHPCYWPSGREIRRLSIARCLELLAAMGVEGADVDALAKPELRALIHRLKRQAHLAGDCECSAAAYIRRGGGT